MNKNKQKKKKKNEILADKLRLQDKREGNTERFLKSILKTKKNIKKKTIKNINEITQGGNMTKRIAIKLISKWYRPSKPPIKLPYLWSSKEILHFAEKMLYKLQPIDRTTLMLIWYFRKDITRLKMFVKENPRTIKRYRSKLSLDYQIVYKNVDFLTLALHSRVKFNQERRKNARNLSNRGPNKLQLMLLNQTKKLDEDDKIIFFGMILWWTWIIWEIVIKGMYLEAFIWPLPLTVSEEIYNMHYMWYKIQHDFRIIIETTEQLEQLKGIEN